MNEIDENGRIDGVPAHLAFGLYSFYRRATELEARGGLRAQMERLAELREKEFEATRERQTGGDE